MPRSRSVVAHENNSGLCGSANGSISVRGAASLESHNCPHHQETSRDCPCPGRYEAGCRHRSTRVAYQARTCGARRVAARGLRDHDGRSQHVAWRNCCQKHCYVSDREDRATMTKKPIPRDSALPRKRSASALSLRDARHRQRVIPDKRAKVERDQHRRDMKHPRTRKSTLRHLGGGLGDQLECYNWRTKTSNGRCRDVQCDDCPIEWD